MLIYMNKSTNKKKILSQEIYCPQGINQELLSLKRERVALRGKKNSYFKISILKLITILSSSERFIPTE